jgi:hypothetical protein
LFLLLLPLLPLKFITLFHLNLYVALQLYEETGSQHTFVTQQNPALGCILCGWWNAFMPASRFVWLLE